MTFVSIRRFCLILAANVSILGPFFAAFHRELRFSMYKTTGILAGYLFFVFFLSSVFCILLPGRPWTFTLMPCLVMPFHVILCVLLSKMHWTVIVYTLFMFQNFADAALLFGMLLRDLFFSLHIAVPGIPSLLPLLMLFVLCLCACLFLTPYLRSAAEYTRTLSSWKTLASIPLIFSIIFRCIGFDLSSASPFLDGSRFFRCVLWIACVCLVHYVILHALLSLSQNFALREEYKTIRLLADLQTSQMSRLQKALDQTAQAKHNMRFHFAAVKGFLEQKKSQKALNYINDYLGSSQSSGEARYCLNLPANSLLDYYLDEAKKNSIRVTAHVSLPAVLPLSEIDFCTILGNLLSNALEACMRQEGGDPSITVNIRQSGSSMITLSISNSYSHEIRRQNGIFLSSKGDRPGIGTASVRYLVERYHGVLNYKYGNGLFVASLLLNPEIGRNA